MLHAFHKKGIVLTVVVLLISFGIQITVSNRASDVFIDTINFNVLNMPSEVLINKTGDCWVNASSTITISVFGEPGNVSMNASIDITGCGLDISIDEYDAVEEGYWVDNGVYEVDISPRHCWDINITVANSTENLTASRFFFINGSKTTVQTSGGHDKTMTVGITEDIYVTVKDMDGDPIKIAPVHLTWVDKNWDNAICINKTEGDNTHGNGKNGEYYFTATVNEVGYIIVVAAWPFIMFHSWDLIKVRESDTLYVGGSGPGNYSKIQDAIDDASDRDTVFVYNGTYFEHIIINKTISLVGENAIGTVINGQQIGTVVMVSASSVIVSGFTLKNNEFSVHHSAIQGSTNFSTIKNNIITNDNELGNSYGIYFRNSSYNLIENNTISNCYYSGISLEKSCYNNVLNNTIFGTFLGCIQLGYSSNNNTIMRNNLSTGVTISLLESDYNQIQYNHLTNPLASGNVLLANASYNNITHNNFIVSRLVHFKAYFLGEKNFWNRNYWNRPRLFPKPILGAIYRNGKNVRWLNFDWHPAQEPYDI